LTPTVQICDLGSKLSHDGLRLEAIIFGSDDFAADIGATRTTEAKEVLLARQTVVCYAKAFGLQAIDMVNIELGADDFEEKLVCESQDGARMGFTGKQCIHPKVRRINSISASTRR
jgi:citrate lyase subunit beta-like protein